MSVDMGAFGAHLRPPPHRVAQAGPSRPRERPTARDKQKQPIEDPAPKNPRAAEPSGFMAAPRAIARVEEGS